jgi:hypothetical protein
VRVSAEGVIERKRFSFFTPRLKMMKQEAKAPPVSLDGGDSTAANHDDQLRLPEGTSAQELAPAELNITPSEDIDTNHLVWKF